MTVIGMVLAGGFGKRMGGGKPKVLCEVEGIPMVVRAINAVRDAGAERLVAVLCHRADEVSSVLPEDVETVVQTIPRGTGSAIVDSIEYLDNDEDILIVAFGDMPWLNPCSAEKLIQAIDEGADAAVLTFRYDDPPHFGRIVRDEDGGFIKMIQYKDCSIEQLENHELDAGMFAFRNGPLKKVLSELDADNAAGELYLTDAPEWIVKRGGRVSCVSAENAEEALGVNDPKHLDFANRLPELRQSEQELSKADEIYWEILQQRKPTGHRV